MADKLELTYFVWDTNDNRVAVEETLPANLSVWPLQVLRISGSGPAPSFLSPMTAQEFSVWRTALEAAGLRVDLRFKGSSG
jgi:hypothetical protein